MGAGKRRLRDALPGDRVVDPYVMVPQRDEEGASTGRQDGAQAVHRPRVQVCDMSARPGVPDPDATGLSCDSDQLAPVQRRHRTQGVRLTWGGRQYVHARCPPPPRRRHRQSAQPGGWYLGRPAGSPYAAVEGDAAQT